MENKITRRYFIAAAAGSIVSIGLPGTYCKLSAQENAQVSKELRPDGHLRIPPGQHAVKALSDMGGTPGPGQIPAWKLKIYGEVKKPVTLSFDDLSQFERTAITCDVHCVTGWTLLDSRWGGILLTTLMEFVGVKDSAGFVVFSAPAGYSSNIPMKEARKDNVILADSFSGSPLPLVHGAPFRGLVPDRYFFKSVKWVESIQFSTVDEPGYYESHGYSNTADPWTEDRYNSTD